MAFYQMNNFSILKMREHLTLFGVLVLFMSMIGVSGVKAQTALTSTDTLRYTKEIDRLKNLLEIRGMNVAVVYRLACDYSLIGAVDSSLHYLNFAAENDLIIIEALADADLENTRKSESWNEIEKRISDIWYEYYPDGNLDYAVALIKLYNEDQLLQSDLNETKKKYGDYSAEMRKASEEMSRKDTGNMRELDSLIEKYGWPTQNMVGEPQLNSALTIILHSDLAHQKKYLPFVEESFRNGELKGRYLASLTDNIRFAEGKDQVYGTQLNYNDSTRKYELYPVEDELNLNKRRIAIGLDSIHDYIGYMDRSRRH